MVVVFNKVKDIMCFSWLQPIQVGSHSLRSPLVPPEMTLEHKPWYKTWSSLHVAPRQTNKQPKPKMLETFAALLFFSSHFPSLIPVNED